MSHVRRVALCWSLISDPCLYALGANTETLTAFVGRRHGRRLQGAVVVVELGAAGHARAIRRDAGAGAAAPLHAPAGAVQAAGGGAAAQGA